MDAELGPPAGPSAPPEQRVLAALYSAAGCALMLLVIWHQLDPDAPTEWWERVRERVRTWRRERAELGATLVQIHELPETEAPE